ncbi:MAG: sel1 repeat family protein [Neisseriaceae bacterium]|nr:sel1 repeat family protein [Neisseriaceae bacterium]
MRLIKNTFLTLISLAILPISADELSDSIAEISCQNGDSQSCVYLVNQMYKQNNNDDAKKWLEIAAKQNMPFAYTGLGLMYEEGRGVEKNEMRAKQLYEQAANFNDADAQYNLGTMYSDSDTITNDYELARQWYEKAAEQNHIHANIALAFLYLEGRGVEPNPEKARSYLAHVCDIKKADNIQACVDEMLGKMNSEK